MALRSSRLLIESLQNINTFRRIVSPSLSILNRQLSCLLQTGANSSAVTDKHSLSGIKIKNSRKLFNDQLCNQARFYSKKSKSKMHKHEPEIELDESMTSKIIDINKYEEQLAKSLEVLKQEYVHKLSLRTNIGSFNRIEVKADKETIPLNHIASIVQKTPTLIVLNLSQNTKYVAAVMAALQTSGMNLNPRQEGQSTIYITIPKVSREHREELAKCAKVLFNQCKVKLDHHFNDAMRKVRKSSSMEVVKTIEKKLLQDKRKVQSEAEALMKEKQKELLES